MIQNREHPHKITDIINDAEERFSKNDCSFQWSEYTFENEHMNLFVEVLIEQNIWSDRDILNIIKASNYYYLKRGLTEQ